MIYFLTASASVASFSMIMMASFSLGTVMPENLIDFDSRRIRIITEAARNSAAKCSFTQNPCDVALKRYLIGRFNRIVAVLGRPLRIKSGCAAIFLQHDRRRRQEDTIHGVVS